MTNDDNNTTSKQDTDPEKPDKFHLKQLGTVFWTSTAIILVVSAIAMIIPDQFQAASENVYSVISQYFSWFFLLVVFGFGVFLLFLALSPYGRVKLGGDNSKPEFSFWSWIGA